MKFVAELGVALNIGRSIADLSDKMGKVSEDFQGDLLGAGPTVESYLDFDILVDINQQLAALLHTLVDRTAFHSDRGEPLPEPGPQLKNPALSRAIRSIRINCGNLTYSELDRFTRRKIVQCRNIGDGGYQELVKLLAKKNLSFADERVE